MYERFTDRSRKVLQLANQETQRFNHDFIGTEHVLLGLVKAGFCSAAAVLKNLCVDPNDIRRQVEAIVQAGPNRPQVQFEKLPQTPWTKKVIDYAIEEARSLNHGHVGTEHLLLGLIREQEGVASQILQHLGLRLDEVRNEVALLVGGHLPMAVRWQDPSRKAPAPDLPAGARRTLKEVDEQIDRLNDEKEAAVAKQDYETAAHLRDQADKAKRSKDRVAHEWLLANMAIDPSWLTWNDAAVPKIARMIADLKRWENLPLLAGVLEQAGCTNAEVLEHCRHPGEHGDRCWVVDLLLAKLQSAQCPRV